MKPRNVKEQRVLEESHRGLAPSQIDVKLNLASGEARETMVGLWARNKEKWDAATKRGTA